LVKLTAKWPPDVETTLVTGGCRASASDRIKAGWLRTSASWRAASRTWARRSRNSIHAGAPWRCSAMPHALSWSPPLYVRPRSTLTAFTSRHDAGDRRQGWRAARDGL